MADSHECDKEVLLLLLLLRRRRLRWCASFRTQWVRRWIERRSIQGAYSNLIRELNEEDPERFRRNHRLDLASFEDVLSMVGPKIRKQETNMRSSIGPGERLTATLRFLATGETFRSLSFQFRIGERTLSTIVEETCEALHSEMKMKYLKVPDSTAEWEGIAAEFLKKWNYPACIGALDGKHIAIQQPHNSGSEYYNYKQFFSVLLLGLVDANYKFIYIDVGASGRAGDAGVFSESTLKSASDDKILILPPQFNIQSQTIEPHIVGDDAFHLSIRIMKPYAHLNMDGPRRIFNYRFSRARRVVENDFGILSNRFRVFLTTINLSPNKVQGLILAACCLHNYMIEKNKHSYTEDREDTEKLSFTAGAWRNDALLADIPGTNRQKSNTGCQRTTKNPYRLLYL